MNQTAFFYSLISVFLVSLISLVGILSIILTQKNVKKFSLLLVSLATGSLIGDAFFHIIPEVYEEAGFENNIGFAFVVGLFCFFVLEKFLHWHHCHNPSAQNHHHHPIAINNLVADAIHNFIDGMIIAGSFLISIEVGIATTIAVVLHEIPQELGDFGVLLHSGMSKSKALFLNLLSAISAILGTVMTFLLGENIESLEIYLLAFAGGAFLYLALADLVPEIKREESLKHNIFQILFIIIGLASMFALTYVEVGH